MGKPATDAVSELDAFLDAWAKKTIEQSMASLKMTIHEIEKQDKLSKALLGGKR